MWRCAVLPGNPGRVRVTSISRNAPESLPLVIFGERTTIPLSFSCVSMSATICSNSRPCRDMTHRLLEIPLKRTYSTEAPPGSGWLLSADQAVLYTCAWPEFLNISGVIARGPLNLENKNREVSAVLFPERCDASPDLVEFIEQLVSDFFGAVG